MVEEIETHQHPDSLRSLIRKFIEICGQNNNQAFITTHSPEVLQLFATSKETKLFHLRKLENKNVSVNEINEKDVEMIRDIGWNLGNILSYEKFVLVEGELDKTIFENAFFKIKNYWPEELGINFVMCGGFGNQKEMLKALSFTDKKIFVQRDYDDNSDTDIKNTIFDGFKELISIGFQKTEDSDKIVLVKNGITKIFLKNNVIVTGLPSKLTSIQNHATDDYVLDILVKEPAILNKITGAKNTISSTVAKNSKSILYDVLGNYDSNKVIEILKNCNEASIPQELKEFIDRIEQS